MYTRVSFHSIQGFSFPLLEKAWLVLATLYVAVDFVFIDRLCVNEGSSSDESSDDESRSMTVKGNLHEVG